MGRGHGNLWVGRQGEHGVTPSWKAKNMATCSASTKGKQMWDERDTFLLVFTKAVRKGGGLSLQKQAEGRADTPVLCSETVPVGPCAHRLGSQTQATMPAPVGLYCAAV